MKFDAEQLALELAELEDGEEQAYDRTQIDWIDEIAYEQWTKAKERWMEKNPWNDG